jgi:hypothetical protein
MGFNRQTWKKHLELYQIETQLKETVENFLILKMKQLLSAKDI